ncbi:hypothetical protein VTN31DRAFT_5833 [Thermomyces dupontii]|uniref:uncharacterized protein n=1 Tax=Talaromyces thermophilus TaxID=28565 RepID=UPI003742B767
MKADVEKGAIYGPPNNDSDEVIRAENESVSRRTETRRGLTSRHIQFLALGGCIGTGLFVGSGAVLSMVGPAPLLMSYIVMSILVWDIMNVLGEMSTYLPVKGVSVPYFVNRFTEPSLAFAIGYSYWYSNSMLIASEVTAAYLVIEYWTTSVHVAVWITIILAVILILNIIAVQLFGEAEFWFASIKIIAILGLIILGVVLFFGGGPNHDRLGFRYWQNPGAFAPYLVASRDTSRFLAFWTALIRSGFSFIFSPELITTAAGEAVAPRRNIPKATSRFIYRLIAFYVLGSLVIGVTVAYNDPRLLSSVQKGSSDATASPFVIGIYNAGISGLDHVINAAILTSAWSSGNSWLYAGSRVLYSLARNGQAPKIFTLCNRRGVPYAAVLTTFAISCLAYLNVSSSGADVFYWFTNITTVGGFIAWIIILITYLRFRGAMIYNNLTDRLSFRAPFQPYLTYLTILFISLLTLTNGYTIFFPGEFTVSSFLVSYIVIAIFLVFYLGHKIYFRTPWMTRISEVDVISGVEEIDRMEAEEPERAPRNWLERIWFWIA